MSAVTAPDAQPKKAVRPFGWRDKLGYMFGDFGNDMTFMIQAFFMMVYFTKVIGIDPMHIGSLVAAVRVLDAFTDIGMGRLVDTMKPAKDGKFKPWIRRIAIPVALASALLFQPFIIDWSYPAKLTWMVVFYILWGSIFYTAINIPYGSMASVISDKAEHRAELSVFRSTGAQLAFLLVSSLMPVLVFEGSNINAQKFGIAAIVMAVLAVVFYALLYINVEERVEPPAKDPNAEKLGFGKLMGSLFTNRALLAIIAAAILLLLGNLFNGQVASFLYLDFFGNGALQSLASLVITLPPFLLVPFTAPLVRRFGKTELGIVGVLMYVVGMSLNYVLGLIGVIGKGKGFVLFLVLFTIASFGLAVFNFLIWSFIIDVIDYQEVRTHQRDDATVYALYSWARKMGQALSSLLGGIGLSLIGYNAAKGADGKAVAQSDATVQGIWMLFNLVPAVFLLGTLLCLVFWYPLKKKVVEENSRILQERRAGVASGVEA